MILKPESIDLLCFTRLHYLLKVFQALGRELCLCVNKSGTGFVLVCFRDSRLSYDARDSYLSVYLIEVKMSSNIRKQFQRVAQRLDQGLGRYVTCGRGRYEETDEYYRYCRCH